MPFVVLFSFFYAKSKKFIYNKIIGTNFLILDFREKT